MADQAQLEEIIRAISTCSHTDPNGKKPSGAGRWVTVNMRADLWQRICEAASILWPAEGNKRVAPWPDFEGNALKEGDFIEHPVDGDVARVVFDDSKVEMLKWRAVYPNGDSLWLGHQVSHRGRAVRKTATANPLDEAARISENLGLDRS